MPVYWLLSFHGCLWKCLYCYFLWPLTSLWLFQPLAFSSSWREMGRLNQKAAGGQPAPRAAYLKGKADPYLPVPRSRHCLWPIPQISVAGSDSHSCLCWEMSQKGSGCTEERSRACSAPFPTDNREETNMEEGAQGQRKPESKELLSPGSGYTCMHLYEWVYAGFFFFPHSLWSMNDDVNAQVIGIWTRSTTKILFT